MNRWRIIHLVLCALSLGGSLLAVFSAPTYRLWLLSILVTEYGQWLFPVALVLALAGLRGGWPGLTGVALAVIAGVLFLRPAYQAWRVAATLPAAMEHALGPQPQPSGDTQPPPFSLATLWLGANTPKTSPQRVEFTRHGDQSLALDFYASAKPGRSPLVVVIHGGGWNSGTPREFEVMNHRLAQAGYAVAALEYRLAPKWTWPAPREDVLDAIKYLRAHAEHLGLDGSRVVLLGRSAGGQIAEAVAYGAYDPGIRGCIAFYAPADLAFAYHYAEPTDILNSRKLLMDYLGFTLDENPKQYADASGYTLAGAKACPTLLLHGRSDPLVWSRQSERLDARLTELKVPHFFLELDWATHGFDFNPAGPAGQLSTYAVLAFLAKVTAVQTPPPP
jgi:acetyl esterase/lipase